MKARNTQIQLYYQGKDISQDIAPYLLSYSFTDNSGSNADDVSITLEDRAGVWLMDWMPSKGDTLTPSIIVNDYPDTTTLPCGTFSVDQLDYTYPPAVLSIKAVSSDIKRKASSERHTRTWEDVTLAQVCSDIASQNGLSLYMTSYADGVLERVDQTEQSDLSFLQELCADYGQSVKIQNSQIVVYDLEEYEGREAVTTLSIDDPRLKSFRFSSKSTKVYKKAKVKYHAHISDEDYEAEYDDDSVEGSERELVIHERVESQADAERVAKERLLAANRQEITGTLTLIGDVRLSAGVTIMLEGFGGFSGKHFVNKATHKVDRSGYVVTLELGLPKESKKSVKGKKTARKSQAVPTKQKYYEGPYHY